MIFFCNKNKLCSITIICFGWRDSDWERLSLWNGCLAGFLLFLKYSFELVLSIFYYHISSHFHKVFVLMQLLDALKTTLTNVELITYSTMKSLIFDWTLKAKVAPMLFEFISIRLNILKNVLVNTFNLNFFLNKLFALRLAIFILFSFSQWASPFSEISCGDSPPNIYDFRNFIKVHIG